MSEGVITLVLSAVGLVSGMIGAYVSLQNKALLSEVRRELAELENRVIARINGSFVRSTECLLREEATQAKVAALIAERHGGK